MWSVTWIEKLIWNLVCNLGSVNQTPSVCLFLSKSALLNVHVTDFIFARKNKRSKISSGSRKFKNPFLTEEIQYIFGVYFSISTSFRRKSRKKCCVKVSNFTTVLQLSSNTLHENPPTINKMYSRHLNGPDFKWLKSVYQAWANN